MRTTRLVTVTLLLAVAASALGAPDTPERLPSPTGLLIAHGLGGIDRAGITNSLEAFLANYELGRRWFEVDLALTADGDLVCFHTGAEPQLGLTVGIDQVPTSDVLRRCFRDQYTMITFSELLRLAATRPDIVIVTDTKGWDAAMVRSFARDLRGAGPKVRRQVVPQIYNPADMALLAPVEAELGRFDRVIFTLYKYANISTAEVVAVIQQTGARIVAVWDRRFNPELAAAVHRLGGTVLVHTLNLEWQMAPLRELGADGFYIDFYLPGGGQTGIPQ